MTLLRGLSVLLTLIFAGLLSGCAGGPRASAGHSEPVSQMSGGSASWQRAKVHTELAALYYRDGNMAVALEELRTAVEADSSYAPAYNVYGLVHMYLRENALADEYFRRALSLAPGDPEISNNYGWFLCQTGKERDSVAYFLAAVKNPLYPTPERAYLNAGQCSMRAGDDRAAADFLDKATRFGRPVPQAFLLLARVDFNRGQPAEARRRLAELHRQSEPSAESLALAMRVEQALGDRMAQNSYATQLRRRFPESPEARELMKESMNER
jgi:type IV pilus assembly protein PilF